MYIVLYKSNINLNLSISISKLKSIIRLSNICLVCIMNKRNPKE